jgi:hypothetical protein
MTTLPVKGLSALATGIAWLATAALPELTIVYL